MIKRFVLTLVTFCIMGISLGQPLMAQTPSSTSTPIPTSSSTHTIVCDQLDKSSQGDLKCDPNSDTLVNSLVGKIINILLFIIGAAAVIIIIVAGLMYVLSGGNPESTRRAKDAIIYAVIGLIVAIMARFIVFFVLSRIGK